MSRGEVISAREEDDAVALVRVYCGLASTDSATQPASVGSWLAVAVVDDAGRLIDLCEISDDAAGYARLGTLLAERSSGPTGAAIAADSADHMVTMLLATTGRALAFSDDDSADDYAERFADDDSLEELESPQAERRAIGLARALQAGALSAVAVAAPRDLVGFKPILAAHAALATGRQSAATALREVLRELYPAALRAYPDPAAPVALAVLDAVPEPGLLGVPTAARGREAAAAADAVIAQLVEDGIDDPATITEAVTALRVAIAESPRRGGVNRALAASAAEAVRHAAAAVRAYDEASAILIATLTEGLAAPQTPSQTRRTAGRHPGGASPASAPPSSPLRVVPTAADRSGARAPIPRRARPQPTAGGPPVAPPPVAPPPVAPLPMTPPPVAPAAAAQAQPAEQPAPPPVAAPAAEDWQVTPPPAPVHPAPHAARPVSATPVSGRLVPGRPVAGRPVPGRPVPGRPVSGHPVSANPVGEHVPEPAATVGSSADPPGQVRTPIPAHPPAPAHSPAPAAAHQPRPGGQAAPGSSRPVSAPPPPPGITPIVPAQRGPASAADSGEPFRAPLTAAAISSARAARAAQRAAEPPVVDEPGDNGYRPTDVPAPMPAARPTGAAAGSRSNWPLVGQADDATDRSTSSGLDFGRPPAEQYQPAGTSDPPGRVRPPWLADDLPLEPPTLRLVEPPPLADRALSDELTPLDDLRLEPPPLRLVESEPADHNGRGGYRRAGPERGAPPMPAEDDGDLLIFAAARSAWFTGRPEGDDDLDWSSSADSGWQAAERVAQPAIGAETVAGLPRRVPQANLVPGSPLRDDRQLRIVRDPATIAAHTTGYFRGWRRGQEIGGYAVGGRPGRDSAGGWDFSREHDARPRDARGREYRSTGYR